MSSVEMRNASIKAIEPVDIIPQTLNIGKDMAWLSNLFGNVPRGTNFLLSGDPGVGKSTLLQQVALSTASCGEQVLYITTEQAAATVDSRLKMLVAGFNAAMAGRALKNITIIDDLMDLSLLSTLLSRHVFGMAGKHCGTTVIAIDSLHGSGASAGDRKYWNAIYQYLRQSSSAGITTLALAHCTKDNRTAGPRTLEHQVDVTALLRPGVNCRSLYVPKNRNGASRTEPYALTICPDSTRLIPSTLSSSSSATVLTLGEGELVSMEVSLSIPRHERGFAKSCGLPRQDIDAVITVLESCTRTAHTIRNYGVIVRGPAQNNYRRDQNLAIALAALSAMTRIEINHSIIAVGDLSLRGILNCPSAVSIAILEGMFAAGELASDLRILTGSGLDASHPIRGKMEIIEAATLEEGWERSIGE